jgi:hypothetical protein
MPTLSVPQLDPQTLSEVLSLPVEEIEHVEIGRANLLCAEGLPGAEDLDVEEHVGRLDAWAERVRMMTERHLPGFPSIAAHFDNSEPKWRLCAMAKVLHEECGVGYHQERIESEPDWTDSQDLLIHGITGPRRTGTCPSLPVFFIAIGRRLGHPMNLSKAPAHSFSRWDATEHENPAWRDCFNIEFHGPVDFHDDQRYYDWPLRWPSAAREMHRRRHPSMTYIQSLPPAEEFAHSLCQRGVCLEAAGRYVEAVNTYYDCRRYDQRWEGYLSFAKRTVRRRAVEVMQSMGFEPEVIRFWAIGDKLQQAGCLPPGVTSPALPMPNKAIHLNSAPQTAGTDAAFANFESVTMATGPEPLTPKQMLEKQQAIRHGKLPTNLKDIFTSILHKACEGTPVAPSFDLLLPHPPEQKVEPYGSRSKTA